MESLSSTKNHTFLRSGPLVAASSLIGFGMGGFVDGILLHQILQWHQMISAILPPDTLLKKSINMFWDGIFHTFTWTFTAIGIWVLWKTLNRQDVLRSSRVFWGGLLFGWGIFNAMDSIANHYILGLHNVKENSTDPMLWNHGFFAIAILQMVVGWIIIRTKKQAAII